MNFCMQAHPSSWQSPIIYLDDSLENPVAWSRPLSRGGNGQVHEASNYLVRPPKPLVGTCLVFKPKGGKYAMIRRQSVVMAVLVGVITCWPFLSEAQATLTIRIPRHSSFTFVQRLNRDGVKAIQRHDYTKAAGLFYKAYLYDPADPFTLNNLGYISELQGQLDRADKFYKLAAEQGSNADIDLSNLKRLEGQPMQAAMADIRDTPMRINRFNTDAVRLLSEGRGAEAAGLLQQALALNPNDPFTLNNLGVVYQAIGDYEHAMQYYSAAASSGSDATVVVTKDAAYQGKPVSEIAEDNEKRLQGRMQGAASGETQSFELSFRGVQAENENNWGVARQDFMRAYSLDPTNAFTLNNRGYVAEHDGDLESAQFFYEKARQAEGAGLTVGLATDQAATGSELSRVASASAGKVDGALTAYSQQRRNLSGPVALTPRGGAEAPSSTTQSHPGSTAPQNHQ
jgi:Flp pilus assembly protein TadD